MKILWANWYCLLDTTSGASRSVREMLSKLSEMGHTVRIVGATVFDSPSGKAGFGEAWAQVAKIASSDVFEVNDGALRHVLVKTSSTDRDLMTHGESLKVFQRYRYEIKYFKPDFIFFYAGGVGDVIPAEARANGIPCGAYLVNGNYREYRWCRDVTTFITDTEATRDYYREAINIDPCPVGKFINRSVIAKKRVPSKRLLYINPSLAKGALFVLVLAKALAYRHSEIEIEILESRGDWFEVVKAANLALGEPEDYLPPNVIVTPNTPDMAAVYARTHVLIVPSLWWESGARVIAEAQLNGIPVIGTNRGGNSEMIGEGGFLFDLPDACYRDPYNTAPSPHKIASLVDKIEDLFSDVLVYKVMSTKAKKNASFKFDIDANAKRLESHIQKVVSQFEHNQQPYPKPCYQPFNPAVRVGEEIICEPLELGAKGIFIDCGGYDGCSAVKFVVENTDYDCVTFEPNPELWKYYGDVPTTLIRMAVSGKTEEREFVIDEIDGDGSSFVPEKTIDFTGQKSNDQFIKVSARCLDISALIDKLNEYQKIILKLDVEGAEYEILERLIETGNIKRISVLYIEWHWQKIGMDYDKHKSIYERVLEYCVVRDWDALELAIHKNTEDKKKIRSDLLADIIGSDMGRYQNHAVASMFD